MQFPQSSYHHLSHTLLQIMRYHSTKQLFRQPVRLYVSGIPERQMLHFSGSKTNSDADLKY